MILMSTGKLIIFFLIFALVVLVVATVGWVISTRNNLKRLQIKVEEGLSSIDVALTKRYDVLTKMLDATKAYTKYEKETLEKIIKLRQNISNLSTMKDRNEFASSMNDIVDKLNVVLENYPALKADTSFKKLEDAIMDTEEHLQAARRGYNANVTALNTKIVSFPSSIIAKRLNIQEKEMFKAEEIKRQDVKIEL